MTMAFDWDQDVNMPTAGRSPIARHCSATGAQAAAESITGKLEKLLEHFAKVPRATLQEFAAAHGWQNNAVCSTFDRAKYELGWIEETGEVKRVTWGARVAKSTDKKRGRIKGQVYDVVTEQAYHRLTAEGRRVWLGHVERQIRGIEVRS